MKNFLRILILFFPTSLYAQIQWIQPDSYSTMYAENNDTIFGNASHLNIDSTVSFHFKFYDSNGFMFHDTIDTVPTVYRYENLKAFDNHFILHGKHSLPNNEMKIYLFSI